jgi:hypothetical protein
LSCGALFSRFDLKTSLYYYQSNKIDKQFNSEECNMNTEKKIALDKDKILGTHWMNMEHGEPENGSKIGADKRTPKEGGAKISMTKIGGTKVGIIKK